MPCFSAKTAALATIVLLAACSGASSVPVSSGPGTGSSLSVPVSSGSSARNPLDADAEHVVKMGGAVYRFGGAGHLATQGVGWMSSDVISEPILYAASYDGGFINIYPAAGNDQAPIGQLTSGLTSPQGVAVDNTTVFGSPTPTHLTSRPSCAVRPRRSKR